MAEIIINSEETAICPKCSYKFPIHQGISKQAIERYEKEYDKLLQERTQELRAELAKEATRNAEKNYKGKISELKEELGDAKEALQESESRAKKIKNDAETKVKKEFEAERKSLKEDLEQKEAAIKQFKENELTLRKEKNKLEDEKRNFELEQQRKLDAAKKDIEKKVMEAEAEKFKYREAEYKKQLQSALDANEELTRKLEQGSQQLQGEVLELELEDILRGAFPHDQIEGIAKGTRGADVLQRVCTHTGHLCGTIIWEAKRAHNWSDKWLQKLKDDRLRANADIAVLVSTVLPKDSHESFYIIGDVWVTSDQVVRPVAETLRVILLESNKLRVANTSKNEKMEMIYNYLCSSNFSQKVRSVIEAFMTMKKDLDSEKNAMYKSWKKRESQLERVALSMSSMVGELQAIAQDSLPQLDDIHQLSLPGGAETE